MNIPKIPKNFLLASLIFVGCIFLYIGLTPIIPELSWRIRQALGQQPANFVNLGVLGQNNYNFSTSTNQNINPRIIIPSINVDMDIVVDEENEQEAFSRGAWLLPGTAEPGGISGNAVIAAHRFKFISGPKTFYHLDKLKAGDDVLVHWRGQDFVYEVIETKIVEPDDVSILEPSVEPILTLFTCHPVYTTDSRLVVIAVKVN